MSARSSSFGGLATASLGRAARDRRCDDYVVGKIAGDVREGGFELVARNGVLLLEPAQHRLHAAVGVLGRFGELLVGQAELGRRDRQIEIVFVLLIERVDHFDAVELQGGIEPGAPHGVGKPVGVARDDGVHFLVRRVNGRDLVAHAFGKHPAAEHACANIVLGLAHALVMTAHARDAVGDRLVLAARILDDRNGPLCQRAAVRVVQEIGLESVRQAEDRLAAAVFEPELAVRAERKFEQTLPATIAGEIVTGPEVARGAGVALDQAIVAADA